MMILCHGFRAAVIAWMRPAQDKVSEHSSMEGLMKLHPLTEGWQLWLLVRVWPLVDCLCLSGWPFTHVHKSNTV